MVVAPVLAPVPPSAPLTARQVEQEAAMLQLIALTRERAEREARRDYESSPWPYHGPMAGELLGGGDE